MFALKALVRLIGITLASIALLLFMVVQFGTNNIEMVCDGHLNSDESSETLFITIEEYQPWIFWTDGQGSLQYQAKNSGLTYYLPIIERVREGHLAVYSFYEDNPRLYVGGVSMAAGAMAITLPNGQIFSGECRHRNQP